MATKSIKTKHAKRALAKKPLQLLKSVQPKAKKPAEDEEEREEPFHGGWGKVVEKRTRSEIHTCLCGNKYLKTRKGQTKCLPCIFHEPR